MSELSEKDLAAFRPKALAVLQEAVIAEQRNIRSEHHNELNQ